MWESYKRGLFNPHNNPVSHTLLLYPFCRSVNWGNSFWAIIHPLKSGSCSSWYQFKIYLGDYFYILPRLKFSLHQLGFPHVQSLQLTSLELILSEQSQLKVFYFCLFPLHNFPTSAISLSGFCLVLELVQDHQNQAQHSGICTCVTAVFVYLTVLNTMKGRRLYGRQACRIR